MIEFIKDIFKKDPKKEMKLVGFLNWVINYTDICEKDCGSWQLWEDGYGKRNFVSTNKSRYGESEKGLPGYHKLRNWKDGGSWPENAHKI